jgi:hypothetical protein
LVAIASEVYQAGGVLVGKLALTGVIIPILQHLPTLIFGFVAKDWWDKFKNWRENRNKQKP